MVNPAVIAWLQQCINIKHIPVWKIRAKNKSHVYRLSDCADTNQTSVVFSGIYKPFSPPFGLGISVQSGKTAAGEIPAATPSLHGRPEERESGADHQLPEWTFSITAHGPLSSPAPVVTLLHVTESDQTRETPIKAMQNEICTQILTVTSGVCPQAHSDINSWIIIFLNDALH